MARQVIHHIQVHEWRKFVLGAAAGRLRALPSGRLKASQLIQEGVDVVGRVAVVMRSDKHDNNLVGRQESNNHPQVPDQMSDAKVLDYVPCQPVTQGPAAVASQLCQEVVVGLSILRPQTCNLEICEWCVGDFRHRRRLLMLQCAFLIFGQSGNKFAAPQLPKALRQVSAS